MSTVRVLAIVFVVAFVSYAAKSRVMFVAGTLGSLLGCVAPHGYTHINGTAEACYMGHLQWTASNYLWWGITGATIACLGVAGIQRFSPTKQFSIRTVLAITTVVAIVLGLIQLANR